MAYDTKELEKKALQAIKKHNLIFIEDVVAYLGISKKAFYAHKLHESNDIKQKIEENKIKEKVALRKDWRSSTSATERIVYYKLMANEEELRRINGERKEAEEGRTVQVENREKGLDED